MAYTSAAVENNMSANNMSENTPKEFYLLEWEANGYDDSDGDVLTYDAEKKCVNHHWWTTRAYCPCTCRPESYMSVFEGIEKGYITEEEVKNALIESDVKKGAFTINGYITYYLCDTTLNIPVHSVGRGRGFKGNGILVRVEKVYDTDRYGRDASRYYAIVFDPKDNSLNKTLLHNLEMDDTEKVAEELYRRYCKGSDVATLCNYVRAANAQYSGHCCTQRHIAKSGLCFPYIQEDFIAKAEVNNLDKKNGSQIAAAKRAAERVNAKLEGVTNWAKGLGKDEEETKIIIVRTLRKYNGDDIDKGADYLSDEVKKVLAD